MQLYREEGIHNGHYFYHIDDGYHYHISEIRWNVVYFKCVHYETGCRGRAKLRSVGGLVHTQCHDHERDYFYPQEVSLRRNILDEAASRGTQSFRSIINSHRMRYPIPVASRMTGRRLRSQMSRRRAARYPPHPVSIEGISAILQSPENASIPRSIDDTDSLYASSVTDDEGFHHVIFATRRMLAFMAVCSILFSDGTFRSTPRVDGIYQIFCLTTIWRSHVIPLAWALMSRKTLCAYVAVLQRFRILMGSSNVSRAITDFEAAQQTAWVLVFHVQVQGCLFHYCNALLKQANELGMKRWLKMSFFMKRIFSWCCALPLLPDDLIEIGFNIICEDTYHTFGERIYQFMRPFYLYLYDNWIVHGDRRRGLSVSGSKNRTNNACETHNRWLHAEMGSPHPNTYVLIEAFARIEQTAHIDLSVLADGGNPSRQRRAVYIATDEIIESLTRDLYNPPDHEVLAVRRFLHAASYRLCGVVNRGLQD